MLRLRFLLLLGLLPACGTLPPQGRTPYQPSLAMTGVFLAICLGLVTYIFRTGYRLKS